MINPFLLQPRERMADWKAFRKSLPHMSETDQLSQTAVYWSQAPTLKSAYDIEAPQAWTTPWEMVQANNWCRFSLAIAMEFTLRLAGWTKDRMILKFIVDYDLAETFFVLEIDGKVWLNHEYRKVIDIPENHEVLCAWSFTGTKYVPIEVDADLRAAA